ADEWSRERTVRTSLIQWLCEDRDAVALVNLAGIRIMGARLAGGLDLSHVHLPFALVMRRCSIAEEIKLIGMDLPYLSLEGSYVGEIDAKGLVVHGDFVLANGFHASGETRIESAKIDGEMNCSGGYFHNSKLSLSPYSGDFKPALNLDSSAFGALALKFRVSRGGCGSDS